MRNFEGPPQFNPENQTEKIEQSPQPPPEQTISSPASKIEETLGSAGEKIFAYLKYKRLKVKEYFGQLNQEDFDQLLDFDFREQLKDTPSIHGVFSPEVELAKIKSLPREHRREALTTFKETLARQREALAACRVFIERTIEFNHEVPKEKLARLVEQFSTQYGFDDRQKRIIEELIDGYYENRKKVLEIRQQFSDNHELVKELTGVNIHHNEKVDVSVGPMTIDIDVNGFNSGRIFERADKPVVDFKYGGFASQSVGENPIFYVVINTDISAWGKLRDASGKYRRNHEYEHQKNKLFRGVFEYKDAPNELIGYEEEQYPETKKVILEDFFDAWRQAALESAKDEITALLYDRDLQTVQGDLVYFFISGQIKEYDYLRDLLSWKEFKDDSFYQETAQRMLVKEYMNTIQRAVDSYAELVHKGKYSIQEATALLTDKPLKDWPKTIKRLLEQKE